MGQWPAPPAFGWCQAVAFVVVPRRFGAPDNLKHLGLVSGRTLLAAERTHGPWRPRRRKTSLNGTEATETPTWLGPLADIHTDVAAAFDNVHTAAIRVSEYHGNNHDVYALF